MVHELTLILEQDQFERIRAVADALGAPLDGVIRDILDELPEDAASPSFDAEEYLRRAVHRYKKRTEAGDTYGAMRAATQILRAGYSLYVRRSREFWSDPTIDLEAEALGDRYVHENPVYRDMYGPFQEDDKSLP
jgi:hypothetical protein